MMAEIAVAWLLLEGAVIAHEQAAQRSPQAHPDHAFYTGKIHAALYFARNVLPGARHKAEIIGAGDRSPLDIPDEAFATVE